MKLTLLLLGALSPLFLLAAEAPVAQPKVRAVASFLFVRPSIQSYYVKGPGGMFVPSADPIELLPPREVYFRNGKDYTPVFVNENVVSDPVFAIGQGVNFSELLIENENKAPVPASGSSKSNELPKKSYQKLVSLADETNAGEWLVCLFKSPQSTTWAPPKVLQIPTEESRFPMDTVLVVNASKYPIGLENKAGKFTSVTSANYSLVALPKLKDGSFAVKAAFAKGDKLTVLCNTSRSAADSARLVFVFNDNPNTDGKPEVTWFVSRLLKAELPPPEEPKEKESKPKSGSGN